MSGTTRKRPRTEAHSSDDFGEPNETSCGIIESVTVKNFMCHDHLRAIFEPTINLVQGRNGSGKSAILTAVVLALGGNTRTTNRGESLKELVQYEKNTATVEVVIKNNGKDAYKYEIYGNSIIIERKISTVSGSKYSIKASNGRLVSSKKDDLKRICEFFNLNVENPLTVLNQDMSRSFLNSTDPKKLYKFFLQATQLQQMIDYYAQLDESIKTSSILIEDRKACLPALEKEVQQLHNRYDFCIKHGDKRKKLTELRRDLTWALIIKLERARDKAEEELNKSQEILSKFEDDKNNFKDKIKQAQQEYKNAEIKFVQISEEITKQRSVYKTNSEIRQNLKEEWKATQREVEKAKRQVQTYTREIQALKEAIKKDHTKDQEIWDQNHRQHQEKIETVKMELNELNEIMKTEVTHLNNIQHTLEKQQESRMQLQFEERNKKKNLQEMEQELRNLQNQQTNGFTVFGQWVEPLLNKIDIAYKQGRFSNKPIGPVGAYVEMLESSWAHIAEMVIGRNISAFIVNNISDEKELTRLFQEINLTHQTPTIICCRFRKRHAAHMIAANEVKSNQYPSLWSVMKVNNDVVANFIIDRCQPEVILLIPTAQEAGELLKNANTVPPNTKVGYTLNGDRYFPDPNYKVYSGSGQKRVHYLQISVGEKTQEIAAEIQQLRGELESSKQECNKMDIELNNLKKQEREANQKLTTEKNKFKRLKEQLLQLQSQEEPPPPNVSQLEEDVKNQEAKHAAAVEALNAVQQQLNVGEEKYREANQAWSDSSAKLSALTNSAHSVEEEMNQFEKRANKITQSDEELKKRFKIAEKQKKELEAKRNEAVENLEKEMEMANKFLPRREPKKSPEEIEKLYKNIEAKLNKEQELRGDPVEIAENYKNLKEKKLKMEAELEKHCAVIKKLRDSLEDRFKHFKNFRKTLSIMVKTNFKETVTYRQLIGNINFNFEKETLQIDAHKSGGVDNFVPSNNSKLASAQQQKMAMLSGGERSVATVAFILALWDVMESPVRILDEFDVFMDIIARKQSLDMMIAAAKPGTQYIYLTPLEVSRNPNLNVFRMPDPERGNTEEMSE